MRAKHFFKAERVNTAGKATPPCKASLSLLWILLGLVGVGAESWARGAVAPIRAGYGAPGPFASGRVGFPSPLFSQEQVYVYRPLGIEGKVPVIFFSPGFSNTKPEVYGALIEHIVSQGYALVFSPFQIVSGDLTLNEKRYDTIWRGFEEAVRRYGEGFDLDRVGYVGHSYGGAASLAMSLRGTARGWGKKSLLLYVMAPWYFFQVGVRELVNFPSHAKLVVQVFEEDTICDHRMGKEIFDRINLPSREKDFLMLRSDQRQGTRLEASHGVPSEGDRSDALDFYGVYRIFDALADYSFQGNDAGRRVALGNGSAEQRFMGVWPDGVPVREMLAGDCVPLTRPSLSFLFPYLGGDPKGMTIVSAASQRPAALAPGAIVSAWGTNFSAFPLASETGPVAELNGTVVKVKDGVCEERIAPLFFTSPTQVNFMIPEGSVAGLGTVSLFNADGGLAVVSLPIEPVAPGLFSANGTGGGPASVTVLRVPSSGPPRYETPLEYNFGQGGYVALPIDLSNPGEAVYLLLYGTGLRYRGTLSMVSVTIGGEPAEVLYVGPQGQFPGLDQINVRVPARLAGRGHVEVRLSVEGRAANPVTVRFR
ncbi:MAG: hypothetical protein ACOYNR_15550 [Blastocatellia bacterium]